MPAQQQGWSVQLLPETVLRLLQSHTALQHRG